MILLIDNYDSFSYNLYQLIGELDPDIRVIRNDELTVEEIRALEPGRIVLSPGPGRPEDAGVTMEVDRELGRDIPILGVPGAAISLPTTIFDVLLPQIFSGDKLTKQDLIRLGDGGLCHMCTVCHFPNCTFGRY